MTEWVRVCALADIPVLGARVIHDTGGNIALFRDADDGVFALLDKCPHKGGPLSQGIVHGGGVTCPLHNWKIDLATGAVCAPDVGCVRTFVLRVERGEVLLRWRDLPSAEPAAASSLA